jgi:hypothetical protein
MNHYCPVCNKAGLSDYRAIQTICPQCNADLKPYLLLHSISKLPSSKTKLFALFGLGLVACVLATLYFYSILDKKQIASENSKTIIQLQDSIKTLQSDFAKSQIFQSKNKSAENEIVIQYKVKNGDYPSKIARFFYNDWEMYKKIEADNNLKQPYILKIGQPLIIKLRKE